MQKPHTVDYMFKHIFSGKSMRNFHTLHQEIILFRDENCENGLVWSSSRIFASVQQQASCLAHYANPEAFVT